jgi:lipid A 3-O-deacylase
VWDIGITPVFRLERAARTAAVPYVEAAVGFHLLSDLRVNFRRNFSTHFQFGDHVGAGVRFGPEQRYDASVRFQHLSNGGLARPNPGINFLQLRLAYRFD